MQRHWFYYDGIPHLADFLEYYSCVWGGGRTVCKDKSNKSNPIVLYFDVYMIRCFHMVIHEWLFPQKVIPQCQISKCLNSFSYILLTYSWLRDAQIQIDEDTVAER